MAPLGPPDEKEDGPSGSIYKISMKPIAITLGDVAGIGPEVIRKALKSKKLNSRFKYEVILADKIPKIKPGKISLTASRFALDSLKEGVAGCLQGNYAALVTGPVNKAGLKLAGFRFPGQTEWLAHRTKIKKFAMMLVGGQLRVSLVTIHVPLKKVSALLTQSKIMTTIQLTYEGLQRLGIHKPRILVAALNPHGGVAAEQGDEESKIIVPAVCQSQKLFGKNITGPYSPDHVFWLAQNGQADAVVCMYHDQG